MAPPDQVRDPASALISLSGLRESSVDGRRIATFNLGAYSMLAMTASERSATYISQSGRSCSNASMMRLTCGPSNRCTGKMVETSPPL